jgi:hypothetical protein
MKTSSDVTAAKDRVLRSIETCGWTRPRAEGRRPRWDQTVERGETLRAEGAGEVSQRSQRSPGADVRREGPNLMGGATEILAADRSTTVTER